ncbi:MAG: hypothetical protein DHS20C18_21040 [Saprospiraceae bacterium]|nr:MAG: hypothetical protein DHS20C18_21040 [Saprospiraceae bacterium]
MLNPLVLILIILAVALLGLTAYFLLGYSRNAGDEEENPLSTTAEILKKVRKIEIKTKGLSKHIFSGEYHSAFKGRGMSFSEVRSYQYGDDVRNIDWNVTARTGDPYIKIFEEERELTVMLLIDMSRSSFFGTHNQLKNEILTEICAVLAFSAINNNDKVGVIFFSDRIEKFIPPKKGKTHILRIIRELLDFKPEGSGTDIGKTLEYFNNVIKKRSICFLLSDFLSKGYESPLRIAARRHDIVGIHLVDPREIELPNVGLIRAKDAEKGNIRWIDTGVKKNRDHYNEWYQQHQEYFKASFLKTGAGAVTIRTDESYVNALLKFFQKRASH